MPLLPAPPTSTATLPRLHLRLPHNLHLPRRAAPRRPRLLLPAAAAGSLPPRAGPDPWQGSFYRLRPRAPKNIGPGLLPPPSPDALLPSQATGLVAASQANFMRVIVAATAPGLEQHRGADLLCVVRALLKKIRRRVLVGDRVLVGAVDWAGRRGVIEDVFERRTEVADPPVANVDRINRQRSCKQCSTSSHH
ncbi:small ribosomal subunit biogenesis GTPase RsgA 1, mitochondrial-like [Lolium perenne]|uniref:small ribosomal subunit biogenesis GTPase RsgA 1, mitochondrial-like n=1 Tax=Lolium perenne TaxID=4522 RepID=UPI003A9A4308